MTTTLNAIRQHSPCKYSWERLLASFEKTQADDEPIELRYILDTLGVEDAIWSLRAIEGMDKEIRLFACDCAESVLHIFEEKYPDDKRPRNAIEVSRKFANGEATIEELDAAREAARDNAGASLDAAWAAAWAAGEAWDAGVAAWGAAKAARVAAFDAALNAAGEAAAEAAWTAEREKQKQLFIKNFCNE